MLAPRQGGWGEGGGGGERGHISRTFGMCDILTKFFGLFLSFVS